jgi:hypothetical protein
MAEFFCSFCDFVNGTLLTLNEGAYLGALGLQFKVDYSPDIFPKADIWDTPAWRRLCDTMSDKKRSFPTSVSISNLKGVLPKNCIPRRNQGLTNMFCVQAPS